MANAEAVQVLLTARRQIGNYGFQLLHDGDRWGVRYYDDVTSVRRTWWLYHYEDGTPQFAECLESLPELQGVPHDADVPRAGLHVRILTALATAASIVASSDGRAGRAMPRRQW